jgi:hypothetical protein
MTRLGLVILIGAIPAVSNADERSWHVVAGAGIGFGVNPPIAEPAVSAHVGIDPASVVIPEICIEHVRWGGLDAGVGPISDWAVLVGARVALPGRIQPWIGSHAGYLYESVTGSYRSSSGFGVEFGGGIDFFTGAGIGIGLHVSEYWFDENANWTDLGGGIAFRF